uniref:Cation:proton antiporter n=1 Tax=Ignisphaera aggregans TaxID=334771 RepID=A0A7C5THL0_9CREN
MINITLILGSMLIAIGAFYELIGAIGMLKLPGFYLRLHSATVSCIGGSVLPLIGIALIALGLENLGVQGLYITGTCVVSAIIILLLAPSGSHSLARAAYIANAVSKEPLVYDALQEKIRGD